MRKIICATCGCLFLTFLLVNYYPSPSIDHPDFIIHGGGCIDNSSVTNSKEALIKALTKGEKYIELDLAFTSDSVVVALHDWPSFNYKTIGIKDHNPISFKSFKVRKIDGKFSPLSCYDIDSIFQLFPQAFLVTDRISNPQILEKSFSTLKNRMIVEAFSYKDYITLSKQGYYAPVISSLMPKKDFLRILIESPRNTDVFLAISKEAITNHTFLLNTLNFIHPLKLAVFTYNNKREALKNIKQKTNIQWLYIDNYE